MHGSFKFAGAGCGEDAQQVAPLAPALSSHASSGNLGRASCCTRGKHEIWSSVEKRSLVEAFRLLKSSAFCPEKQEQATGQAACGQRGAHWMGPCPHAGVPKNLMPAPQPEGSAEVSGAMKTYRSRKSAPLCFLSPPCSPIIFINLCFAADHAVLTRSAPTFCWVKVDVCNKQTTKTR